MQVKVVELAAFWKTTSFRLTVVVTAGVSIAAILIIAAVYWQVNAALTKDLARQVHTEATELLHYSRQNSQHKFIQQINLRSRVDHRRLYLLTDINFGRQAGNLQSWPASLDMLGKVTVFRLPGKASKKRLIVGLALQIDSKHRLLVAREAQAISDLGGQVAWWMLIATTAMALTGILLGFIISRLVLSRIALITSTSKRIMSGNLSERIPLSGSADEFDGLANNLNHMLERIEELMAGIQEVSDHIAHDLKTPLNRLRNRAEDALNCSHDKHESLEQILIEADDLIRIFNGLLQIAQLEANASQSTREQIDIATFIGDIVDFYTPVVEEAHASIVYEHTGSVPFYGHRQLLAQALTNLIENSLKYGSPQSTCSSDEEGAKIQVHLISCKDHVALSVSDRGAGIPADQHKRALKRFGRLDTSRSQPGTGLGLSLVHAVAKIHQGHLKLADNKPGLIATMTLPLAHVAVHKAQKNIP